MDRNTDTILADAFRRDWKDNLDGVLESSPRGVIFYDPHEDCVFDFNARAAVQIGYQHAELKGMKGDRLFGEGGINLLRTLFSRMQTFDRDLMWGQPLSMFGKDGRRESYVCTLSPIPKAPGRDAPMAMCMSFDSVRACGEASDVIHWLALESLRNELWEFDVKNGIIRCSRKFRELLNKKGDSPDKEWTIAEWGRAVHPDDAEEAYRNMRRLLTEGVRYRNQYRVRFNDGDWYWLLSIPHAVLNNAEGEPEKVYGIHFDITDIMHKERTLTNTEEQLNMIFENAGIGIAMADSSNAALLKVNPALAVMLGLNREDLEGKRLSTFAHPEDRLEIRANLDRLIEGGRRVMLTAKRFMRRDGGILSVNLTATLSKSTRDGPHSIVLMLEDVTERQIQEEKLRYEATHDVMTGAWARWVLLESLTRQVGLVNRHLMPLAFCICDLDHFKLVNDHYGHQAGDGVLVEFVRILKESIRDTDVIGRYGGEEFALVFPNTTVAGAKVSMERAGKLLREMVFSSHFGMPFRVTATFGLAEASKDSTPTSVIANADAALYEGKKQGRDRVVVYTP